MDGRLKVVVLFCSPIPLNVLDCLIPLTKDFEIEVITLLPEEFFRHFHLKIPVKIYEATKNMPGFLRGLDALVKSSDLVFIFHTYDFTSYQAVSLCQRHQKPSIVFTNPCEPHSTRVDPELLALHYQILRMADQVFVFSEEGRDILELEGVEKTKISTIDPFYSIECKGYSETDAQKFRQYVGIQSNEIVLLVQNLNDLTGMRKFLFGLKFLIQSDSIKFESLKTIFANCAIDHELKYFLADSGLGAKVLILNQNTSPFRNDLYSACDLIFDGGRGNEGENFDFSLLDAMRVGAIPLGYSPLLFAEKLKIKANMILGIDYRSIAHSIQQAWADLSESRANRITQWHSNLKNFDSSCVGHTILNLIETRLLNLAHLSREGRRGFENDSQLMTQLIKHNQQDEARSFLIRWEQKLEELSEKQKADLFYLKGEFYMSLMDLEAALQAFEYCLKWDSNHWKALLKLAKISMMGQADEDALTFYKKALAVHPNLAEAYEGIGLIHFRNKLFDEAIFWLSRGVLIEPRNRRCPLGLTQTCLLVEEPRIGIETLESMRAIVGDDISIVMALGQLYFIEGKFERGKEMVDLALARTQTKRLAS